MKMKVIRRVLVKELKEKFTLRELGELFGTSPMSILRDIKKGVQL